MEKPEIDFPEGPAPDDLVITDITVGDGAEARPGNTVYVHYVGVTHDGGEAFRLGIGQVIQGWDEGIVGMKVGGRRQLVIPPHMAYGSRGAGGVIKPNATLIFLCDLIDVR